MLGVGVFLVWWSFWPRPSGRGRADPRPGVTRGCGTRSPRRATPRQPAARPRGLRLGGRPGLRAGLRPRRVVPVALCFGVMAALGPVGGRADARARRRRAQLRDLWPDAVDNIASGRPSRAGPPGGAQPARRSGVRRSCARRSPRSPRTTARPGGSTTASTDSRTGSPTPSATGWWSRCASPGRSAGPTSVGCCARCRRSCVMTRAPGPSWRRGRGGRSTPPGWPAPPRGSCWRCSPSSATSLAGVRGARRGRRAGRRRAVTVVAYRLMVRIGRLPEEERVLR